MWHRMPALAGLSVLCLVLNAWAQTSSSDAGLSPWGVAGEAARMREPDAQARVRSALRDERADVRAAAARVVHAAGARDLVADVARAWGVESDLSAFTAMARALLVLGLDPGEPRLRELLSSGPEVATTVADALGRVRGRDVPLDAVRSAGVLETFLAASSWDPAAVNVAAVSVLRDGSVAEWNAILRQSREGVAQATLADGLLAAALGHQDDAWRLATLWHLVGLVARGGEPGTATRQVLSAVNTDPEATDEEAFTRAALARLLAASDSDPAWLGWLSARADPGWLARLTSDPYLVGVLTERERKAMSGRLDTGRPLGQDTWWRLPRAGAPSDMRTAGGYPPGLVADVLRGTGCRPSIEETTVSVLRYTTTGRVASVSLPADFDEDRPCHEALRVLLLNDVAPVGHAVHPARDEVVVLVLEPSAIECLTSLGLSAAAVVVRPDGREVQAPTKTRHVTPIYPRSAQGEGAEGLVTLDAVISPSGCVGQIESRSSPDVRLTLAALVAVSQWRFTPTMLEGQPVPVRLTVTVSFTLN